MDFWRQLRRHGTDVLIGAVVVATAVEVTTSVVPGSKPLLAVACLAAPSALFLRRRHPLGAPLATTTIMAVASFFVGPGMRVLAVPVLTALLAGLLMGYGNDRREAVVGLVLQYACIQVVTAHFGDPGVGDVVFTTLLLAGPWLAGQTARARIEVGRRLEERTRELEQAREDAARAAVVAERLRIARELHDIVAHSISVMTIQAGAARLLLEESVEKADEPLRMVEETGRETLSEMRRLLGLLRHDEPAAQLESRQSLEQLGDLLEQYRQAGLAVELTVDGDERALPQGLDLAAYRVVQEALTNTLKHAPGSSAAVHVAYRPDAIELCVTDTGSMRAPDVRPARADGPGHGIVGMRERAEIYGGRLDAGPDPDGGFRVTASFPLEAVAV